MRGFCFSSVLLGLTLTSFIGTADAQTLLPTAPNPGTPTTVTFAPPTSAALAPTSSVSTSADPQARVGRISLSEGTVSFHTPDQESWSFATLNYPVVSGDSFWTEPDSRAEIQVGSTALRLDASTEVDINELNDHGLRAEVTQGNMNIHVSTIAPGEIYQIITPHEAVNVLQPGTYRIHPGTDTTPDEIAVLRGSLQVGDAESSLTIGAGETALIQPGPTPNISVHETAGTPFDNWSLGRDNFEEPRRVVKYVSPEMTGYEDLGNYGNWQTDSSYGTVWYPSAVPVGWQPYHYGHWVWVSPWGWTWIDEAPWGFAPFHYGRWAYLHNRWGWVPGTIVPRPVYAPALVAFIGGGGWNVSVGLGERPVGWFPLGPHEVFHPGYRVSDRYVQDVNITNVRNFHVTNNFINHGAAPSSTNESFVNRRFATVVREKDFAGSRPVATAAIKLPAAKLAAAPVNTTATPPLADNHVLRQEAHVHQDAPTPPRVPAAPNLPAVTHANLPSTAAIPPAAPRAKSVFSDITHQTETNVAPQTAPGPAIQHRNRAADYMPSMRTSPSPMQPALAPAQAGVSTEAVRPEAAHQEASHQEVPVNHMTATMETSQAHLIEPRATPQQTPQTRILPQHVEQPRAAPRPITVEHPAQAMPLTPSHQGWVRQAAPTAAQHAAPQQAAPQHVEHGREQHAQDPHQEH